MTTTADRITCVLCGHQGFYLGDHILERHDRTIEDYQEQFPGAPVVSQKVWDTYTTQSSGRRRYHPPQKENLEISLGTVPFKVHTNVPEEACLPLPAHYKIPEHGKLKADINHAAASLARNRSMYVWGLPGSGKDAFFHAFSNMCRRPGKIFQIQPGVDITSWFYTRSFDQNGTFWEEGEFLKAARDGYLAEDGERIPYLILITDFDRADRSQAEALRLVLDSISGRIKGPTGETYKVLEGTTIAATANTAGGGDTRGRMISANPLDASLMDRFQKKIKFHWMDWDDESEICQSKFPSLVEACPEIFAQVGAATVQLRKAIEAETIYWEWSHRAVCNWLTHCEDVIWALGGRVPPNILRRGARVVLDGAPDDETREGAKKIMDPHISGGVLDSGNYREDSKLDDNF